MFHSWYPDTFNQIFGKQNLGSLHGFMHKHLKNVVLSLFGPESLKKMLPEPEGTGFKQMRQWSSHDMIELKDATANVSVQILAAYFEFIMQNQHLYTMTIPCTDDIQSDCQETHRSRCSNLVRKFEGEFCCFHKRTNIIPFEYSWHCIP